MNGNIWYSFIHLNARHEYIIPTYLRISTINYYFSLQLSMIIVESTININEIVLRPGYKCYKTIAIGFYRNKSRRKCTILCCALCSTRISLTLIFSPSLIDFRLHHKYACSINSTAGYVIVHNSK